MKQKRIFVNALTFSRVPTIFLWLVLAVCHEFGGELWMAIVACAMMLASGVSDAVDGHLARKWNVVSALGKMADPLMDKVFFIVAFPTIAWQVTHQGESDFHAVMMLSFTVLYMLRDTWVTFLRSVGAMFGADVAAMWLGKVRTALSFPGAGWVYMYLAFHRLFPQSWQMPWFWSCILVEALLMLLTVISIFTYTSSYWPFLKNALERK